MSRANRAASRITLADDRLHGYVGPVDVISCASRPWWRRWLRLPAKRTQQHRMHVVVRGSSARGWSRRR